ncbi:PQQ-dependent sugar dehydrogenase [Streptomyces sp. 549]|uniref:PQQ-dependent sugar dehydrogenase n=1 Tax=Streptomyces sp. 549 TaxID=3049076 RepID=UPI0024C294FF|nr:PQQ-dependent sugar dehydrogenase [Streptomyces sp. 549]MDK1472088.1 PQQ-dependent sugar dehydrogenase [Streptomyces sp. 549]
MHRTRTPYRTTLAAFASALLIGGALTVAASPTATAASAGAHEADAKFQQVTLAKGVQETGEPMTLAVLPDSSVLHTSRDGTVRLTDSGGTTTVAGRVPVYSHDEEGLQGVGVDPDFAENRHVYLYYAPPLDTPAGGAPETGSAADFAPFDGVNRLSRFVLDKNGTLDTGSEETILDVPATRGICCHVGGDIAFDADGNLLLSTGDDTNPFQSDGYTPIDERPDRNPAFDAQRTSGNTNDLRGKILRVSVNADGSYDIPDGNLFEPGTDRTRPEIYAMGFRNPFRMSVDKPTGTIYVGDYGPDAGAASPARGPSGQVEFNRITAPGNYGWPYCHGDNDAYVDFDFADRSSGEPFDCAAPRNNSPHNTGLTELPAAQPGWITYDDGSVPEFGTGSESPMGGPVYRYDPDLESEVKFPEAYDGDFFAGEFGRRWIKRIEQDDEGAVTSINSFLWEGTQVMDMEFGPDGALYVLDYGTGFFNGDHNSALYRIENATDGYAPIARATADTTSGQAPLRVAFSSDGSSDADGDPLSYAWDFGDGGTSTEADPTHTYTEEGQYVATVTARDPSGKTGQASVHITVGNTAPTVELKLPADGQLFSFGDSIPFRVEVSDPEDGEVDCSRVKVTYILGHDSHGHPVSSADGCEGSIQTAADGEHDPNANIFGVFDAEYTDRGAGDLPPLTTHDQHRLTPKHRQAEHFDTTGGAEAVDNAAARGGRAVGRINDGDWIAFTPYVLDNATAFTARAAGGTGGVEVRSGAPDGPLLGTAEINADGDRTQFERFTTALAQPPAKDGKPGKGKGKGKGGKDGEGKPGKPGKGGPPRIGTTTLYLVFTGDSTDGTLFELDDFTFTTG